MKQHFSNIEKERETYAVVAIAHVENFTNLVAPSYHDMQGTAFDTLYSIVTGICRNSPKGTRLQLQPSIWMGQFTYYVCWCFQIAVCTEDIGR